MKVNGKMMRKMESESILIQMELFIKGNGKIICNKGKESFLYIMAKIIKENLTKDF